MAIDNIENFNIIIFGSGLAAFSVIESFKETNIKILIIEGGKPEETFKNDELSINNEYGHFSDYWNLHWVRVVGGTSKRWGGLTATLSDQDFNNWPITYQDLEDYYKSAWNLLGSNGDDIVDLYNKLKKQKNDFIYKPLIDLDAKILTLNDYEKYNNIKVITRANILKINSTNRRNITSFSYNYNGEIFTKKINEKQNVVLACGGIGNAQILLQPEINHTLPIGNESKLVGKYLMEHPHTSCGEIYFAKELSKNFIINDSFYHTFVMNKLLKNKNNLLNCSLHIKNINEDQSDIKDFFEAKINKKLKYSEIYARSEQEPSIHNSITVIPEKNWAGIYKLEIRNVFSSLDLMTIEKTTRLFGHYLLNNNIGFIKIKNNDIYRETSGGGHTMGTTKMGHSINDSVCDKNCRVHGYSNLFLAGSSVFPSGGCANPTISLMALGIRLSDYLYNKINKEI